MAELKYLPEWPKRNQDRIESYAYIIISICTLALSYRENAFPSRLLNFRRISNSYITIYFWGFTEALQRIKYKKEMWFSCEKMKTYKSLSLTPQLVWTEKGSALYIKPELYRYINCLLLVLLNLWRNKVKIWEKRGNRGSVRDDKRGCQGSDFWGAALAPCWISFVILFPRAAEPTEHLEDVFTSGCLTCTAPLLGITSLVRGENMLREPKLLELSTAIHSTDDCSLVAYRSGVISTDTEDAISANSSQSLLWTCTSTTASAGAWRRGTLCHSFSGRNPLHWYYL